MHREAGFSVIKLLFGLAILAAVVWYGYLVIPVYNASWKAQDTFESVVRNMPDASEQEIRVRLPELLRVKYVAQGDLPDEFYGNIQIKASFGRVVISSYYHVTLWPLGPVEGVDPDEEYDAADLQGMDKLRHKARLDFDFEPNAETP
jgi:hypothetical protein